MAKKKRAAKTEKSEIPPVPGLPDEVIDAIDREKLVVFIGAGVSRLVGCKGWDELATDLVQLCYDLKSINYREYETLRLGKDQKKTITICFDLLKRDRKRNSFFKTFNKALAGTRSILLVDNIYKQLAKIRAIFITTNADEHFDDHFASDRIYYDVDQFAKNLETQTLHHIHGKKKPRCSLVFTVDRYLERYSDPVFHGFLRRIFSREYVVLFLGYGLSEFELLDYVITKVQKEEKAAVEEPPKHFILLPYFREEVRLMEMDQLYYEHLGINVLGYQKDEWGYKQLYRVVKQWNEDMIKTTKTIEEGYGRIDRFIEAL